METEKQEIINKVRIFADLCSNDNPTNYGTRNIAKLKCGDNVIFEFLLLNGGKVIDVSQLGSLTLEIMDIGCLNAPAPRTVKLLASKTLSSDEIFEIGNISEFESGKYNAMFSFSGEETLWGDGYKWIVLSGYTSDGSKTTFTQGWIEVFARYSTDIQVVPELEPQFLKRDYADAMYLKTNKNFADLSDVTRARENLSVHSKSEIQMLIASLEQSKSNRDELWFKNGSVGCSNKWTSNSYSFAMTFAMTHEEAILNEVTGTSDYQWVGTCVYGNNQKGFCLSLDPDGSANTKLEVLVYGTKGLSFNKILISDFRTRYCDNKHHSLVVVCNSSKFYCQIDNDVYTGTPPVFDEIENTRAFKIYSNNSRISRVKYFNFDMSVDDALYTIDDYVSGKDEPPFLDGVMLSLADSIDGVQILDNSGSRNHAIISGVVRSTKENNPARCVDVSSFSWAGTATTQKFANSDIAIPANSKVVAYAKASVAMSASFVCGANSAVAKDLSTNALTEIGTFLNDSQGAFTVKPTTATTGKMEVYLTIERF